MIDAAQGRLLAARGALTVDPCAHGILLIHDDRALQEAEAVVIDRHRRIALKGPFGTFQTDAIPPDLGEPGRNIGLIFMPASGAPLARLVPVFRD